MCQFTTSISQDNVTSDGVVSVACMKATYINYGDTSATIDDYLNIGPGESTTIGSDNPNLRYVQQHKVKFTGSGANSLVVVKTFIQLAMVALLLLAGVVGYSQAPTRFRSLTSPVTFNMNTGTEAALKAALNSVPAGGRLILSGSATVVVDSLVLTKSITISRMGGAILRQKAGALSPFIHIRTDGVNIEGLYLDGNRANQTNANAHGIQTEHGRKNIRIRSNTLSGFYGVGIRLQGAQNVWIQDNTLENCNQPGNNKAIVVRSEYANSAYFRILNNHIDAQASLNGGIAIQSAHPAFSTKNFTVAGNTVLMGEIPTGQESLGIELYAGYSPSNAGTISDATVSANMVQCNGTAVAQLRAFGISLGAQPNGASVGIFNVAISANSIKNCGRLGLELLGNNLSATGNVLENSGEISCNATNSAGGLSGITISANVLRNCVNVNYAIRLQSGSNPIRNASITSNQIFGGTFSQGAVYVYGGDLAAGNGLFYNITVSSNGIYGVNGTALHIEDSGEIEGLKIGGNNILFSTATANSRGIQLVPRKLFSANVTENVIVGADSTTTAWGVQAVVGAGGWRGISVIANSVARIRNGLSFTGNVEGLTVTTNNVTGAGGYGLAVSGSPTGLVYGANTYTRCVTTETISGTAVVIASFGVASSKFFIGLGPGVTIASGIITVSASAHPVSTEGGASTDDLDTVNGGQTGQILILYASNNTNDIVLRDNVGNLRLNGNFTMDHNQDRITLQFDGTNWIELNRSDNSL